jgi:nitrate/nitrite transport system substrate-binding protein
MGGKLKATRRNVLLGLAAGALSAPLVSRAKPLKLEKEQVKIGFIKLTDMVPLAVAYEKGFFEDEGLYVTLEPQANWKVVLDRVITGELDCSHMLAGQPLGSTIGVGTKADLIIPYSFNLNSKAVTVSNAVWQQMLPAIPKDAQGKVVRPVKASTLKPVIDNFKAAGKPFRMAMVFPVSTHNYMLRYWLASGGVNPGYYSPSDVTGQIKADVLLSVTPPPQMPATLEAGTINGYCVGEPWNEQAIFKKVGLPVIADIDIWKNNPDKVLGCTKAWADKNPNTLVAIVKALTRAAQWLDASLANRKEAAALISQSQYVGADVRVITNSMTGTFEYQPGEKLPVPDFNVFYRYNATYPFYSDAIWYLTQMRRWGQIPEGRPDSWYAETAKKVYRPDIYLKAAKLLLEEGRIKKEDVPWDSDGYKASTKDFIDGIEYDGRKPNAYIDSQPIGLKGQQKIEGVNVVGK